jgi:asparagine synthase (glutamine-hydrolysing)
LDWRERGRDAEPKLIVARDPFGMKPLYVAKGPGVEGGVSIASELKALLAAGRVDRRIDRQSLVDYLAHGFVLQPRTILESVRMVEAGTYEIYEPGKDAVAIKYWWMPAASPRTETIRHSAERLRAVLEESVALHAFADAPVGVFLSGGIDSTVIAALMKKHLPRLRSYTMRLPDSPFGDESAEAMKAAERIGCENSVVETRGEDVARLLPRFVRDLDQPSNDGLNTWLISRAAARDVRGVLSGLGGDEWFAGYPSSSRMARMNGGVLSRAGKIAGGVAHAIESLLGDRAPRRALDAAARRDPFAMWIHGHSIFSQAAARRMVGSAVASGTEMDRFVRLLDEQSPTWHEESPVGLASLLDVGAYLRCQLLRDSDVASMASSLELRVPFVDVRVAEFSRSCRDDYKLRPNRGSDLTYASSGAKRVMIEAVRDLLPPELERRKKRGFSLPLEHWMKTSLREMVAETTSMETMRRRGLLDAESVERALRREDPERIYLNRWALAVLELWMREVLDAPMAREAPRAAAFEMARAASY